jgi:hypothetical protein
MTSRYTIKIVEDLIAEGVESGEVAKLLDMAAYAVERIAPTLARRADFDLSDFATAKRRGIDGYALTLRRQGSRAQEAWTAEFVEGNRCLRALLTARQPD